MSRQFSTASSQYLYGNQSLITGSPHSTSVWFYPTQNEYARVISTFTDKDSGLNYLGKLQVQGDLAGDPIRFACKDSGGTASATTTTGFSINTWHHALGVLAANNDRRVYLDGGGKGTDTTSVSPASIDRLSIGANAKAVPAGFFDGRIAEYATWNVALTDDDAIALAKGVSPLLIKPEYLVYYFPLVRDDDWDWINGLSLTPVNSPGIATQLPVVYRPGELRVGTPSPAYIYVTPAAAEAIGATLNPAVVMGSITLTPATVEGLAALLDPAVILGSASVTPAQVQAQGEAQDPLVVLGSMAVTPAELQALAAVLDPSVIMSSMSITPAFAEAITSALDPTVKITGDEVLEKLRIINLFWTFGAGARR